MIQKLNAMKTLFKSFALLVIVSAGTWLFPQQVTAQNNPISLQVFYDELSPYGTWIEDTNYGYVWSPDVDQDFSPYVTNGHWIFTDYGWTWVSDYSWGWAPFHYGRWTIDPRYGNVWIPDTEWGPAWVTWRQTSGYIGWTPMGPGININIALGRSYNVPRDRWVFVRNRDLMQYDLYRYRLDRSLVFNIFNMSMLIRNTRFDNDRHLTYFYGPRREDVQRYSGRVISPVRIRDYDKPGHSYNKDYYNIYRPQMKRMSENDRTPAPRNVNRGNDSRTDQNINRGNTNPNRYPTNTGRYTQPVQQPNANPTRNQEVQQPSRNNNYNNNNTGRYSRPVQQPNTPPVVNQRQQESRQASNPPVQRVQPTINRAPDKPKMVVNPDKDKKEEVSRPRR
jgi:hypothetical protein